MSTSDDVDAWAKLVAGAMVKGDDTMLHLDDAGARGITEKLNALNGDDLVRACAALVDMAGKLFIDPHGEPAARQLFALVDARASSVVSAEAPASTDAFSLGPGRAQPLVPAPADGIRGSPLARFMLRKGPPKSNDKG